MKRKMAYKLLIETCKLAKKYTANVFSDLYDKIPSILM